VSLQKKNVWEGNCFLATEITVLLSICFFLSIVSDMVPPTSEAVPLLGNYNFLENFKKFVKISRTPKFSFRHILLHVHVRRVCVGRFDRGRAQLPSSHTRHT